MRGQSPDVTHVVPQAATASVASSLDLVAATKVFRNHYMAFTAIGHDDLHSTIPDIHDRGLERVCDFESVARRSYAGYQ